MSFKLLWIVGLEMFVVAAAYLLDAYHARLLRRRQTSPVPTRKQ